MLLFSSRGSRGGTLAFLERALVHVRTSWWWCWRIGSGSGTNGSGTFNGHRATECYLDLIELAIVVDVDKCLGIASGCRMGNSDRAATCSGSALGDCYVDHMGVWMGWIGIAGGCRMGNSDRAATFLRDCYVDRIKRTESRNRHNSVLCEGVGVDRIKDRSIWGTYRASRVSLHTSACGTTRTGTVLGRYRWDGTQYHRLWQDEATRIRASPAEQLFIVDGAAQAVGDRRHRQSVVLGTPRARAARA